MRFDLVDAVLELSPDRIVTIKQVTAAEEYLGDHFPTFPVLPGVLMVEAMVQAARRLLAERSPDAPRVVLGSVRGLKYGGMVRPGDTLRAEVTLDGPPAADGSASFRGSGVVLSPAGDPAGRNAVNGRFSLRPPRLGPA